MGLIVQRKIVHLLVLMVVNAMTLEFVYAHRHTLDQNVHLKIAIHLASQIIQLDATKIKEYAFVKAVSLVINANSKTARPHV